MKKLILIGAGDFGREIANVAERINQNVNEAEWGILGYVDDDSSVQGAVVDGYPVLGTTEYLNTLTEEVWVICSVGRASVRKRVLDKIHNPVIRFATLIDPDARIYKDSDVGEGSIICGGSILAINTHIGNHVVVNLNCTIGHDAVIQDYCVVNPGVNVSGKVVVHSCSDLGTGSKVIQGLTVGTETTVGAGAVVIRDLPDHCVAVGMPAKPLQKGSK